MSIKLRSKKLSDGTESFYIDHYYKKHRHYQFLDIKIKKNDPERKQKKEMAERIRTQKEIEFYTSIHGIPNISNGNIDFINYYDSKCKDVNYKCSLSKLKEYCDDKMIGNILPIYRVTEKFCEDYKNWLIESTSNNTAWMYISKLKSVLYKAVREKIISTNPAKHITVKYQEAERVYLTFAELKRLSKIETKNLIYKNAFIFACYTGLRISDIKALTWGQVRDGKIFFRQKKTKGMQYLPLNETPLKILTEIERINIDDTEEQIFKIAKKKTERIGDKIRELAKEAKIDKYITFHTARHTFATLSLTAGVDLYTVSKLLGHKSIKMTEIYAKIINEKADEAVTKLPSLD